MRQFQSDQQTAQQLSRWCFLIQKPRPLIFDNFTSQQFGITDHPLDNKEVSLLNIPETGEGGSELTVHPITAVIARTAGGTISDSDKIIVENYWADRYKDYTDPELGTKPYQSLTNFQDFIVNVFPKFSKFYPDDTERNNIIDLLKNNSVIALNDIIPSSTTDPNGNIVSVTEPTETEIFNDKWYTVNFNDMTQTELERDRFPGIGTSLADAIITERTSNGDYTDPQNVGDRVSGVGSTIVDDLQSQVTEGSLTFSGV